MLFHNTVFESHGAKKTHEVEDKIMTVARQLLNACRDYGCDNITQVVDFLSRCTLITSEGDQDVEKGIKVPQRTASSERMEPLGSNDPTDRETASDDRTTSVEIEDVVASPTDVAVEKDDYMTI